MGVPIKDANWGGNRTAAFTVVYTVPGRSGVRNGGSVKFGGATTDMMAPNFRLRSNFVKDESGRTITHTHYVLDVQVTVFNLSEEVLSRRLDEIQSILEQPAGELSINNLGMGRFRNKGVPRDIMFGVMPGTAEINPIAGHIATELRWSVEFNVNFCFQAGSRSDTGGQTPWMAVNYDQTWRYDFEGRGTRTVKGSILIPVNRRERSIRSRLPHADAAREKIKIIVPATAEYRRISQDYNEDFAKSRLTFSIVDEEIDDDAFPVDITDASGTFTVGTGGSTLAEFFVRGNSNLSMTLRTRKGVHKSVALAVFLRAALAKQAFLVQALQARSETQVDGTVFPVRAVIQHRLFTRETSFSMDWMMTGSVYRFLFQSKLWDPIPGTSYAAWRNSIESPHWDSRGQCPIGSRGDTIVDLCEPTNQLTVQDIDGGCPPAGQGRDGKLTCPNIRENQSWIRFDMNIRYRRRDQFKIHRAAVRFAAESTGGSEGDANTSDGLNRPAGPAYNIPEDDEHVEERTGYPTTKILLEFNAIRLKHKIEFPKLKSYKGLNLVFEDEEIVFDNKIIGDIAGCCVYHSSGWQLYNVRGGQYVRNTTIVKDPLKCPGEGGDDVKPVQTRVSGATTTVNQ